MLPAANCSRLKHSSAQKDQTLPALLCDTSAEEGNPEILHLDSHPVIFNSMLRKIQKIDRIRTTSRAGFAGCDLERQ